MPDDEFEDLEDEEEPERLKKKWDAEEERGFQAKECPHCGKPVLANSFFCLYCGERVFEKSGLLGKLAYWTKQGKLILVVALVLFAFIALTLF